MDAFLVFLKSLSAWLGLGTAAIALYFLKKYVDDTGSAIDKVEKIVVANKVDTDKRNERAELIAKESVQRTSNALDVINKHIVTIEKIFVQFEAFKNYDFKDLKERMDFLRKDIDRIMIEGPNPLKGKLILIDKEIEVITGRINAITKGSSEMNAKTMEILRAFNSEIKKLKSDSGKT